MSDFTEMSAVKTNLNLLLLGINIALINHHYWTGETFWMVSAAFFAVLNILSIYLEVKEPS
jgi:predicted membrane metal-binding protein